MVAFPRQNFLDAAPRARAHMRFVHFDGSRDRLPATAATGEQQNQCQSPRCVHQLRNSSRVAIVSGLFATANPSRYTEGRSIFHRSDAFTLFVPLKSTPLREQS